MMLAASLTLAFSRSGDNALLDLAKTLLAKNPPAVLVETNADRSQGRYTFLGDDAKPVATWEEASAGIRVQIDAPRQTVACQRSGLGKNSITILHPSRVAFRMELPPASGMTMVDGSVLVMTLEKSIDRISKPEVQSAWSFEPWSQIKVTSLARDNKGTIWAIQDWSNKEEAYNKMVPLDANGKPGNPEGYEHRFHNWAKFIPDTNMLVFDNGEGKIVFVDTKSKARKEFLGRQVKPFVWLPKLKAVAYMTHNVDNPYGRSTLGLFYPATGENKLVSNGGKFILSYVGVDGDKILMLTNNTNPTGGGAQGASVAPAKPVAVPGEVILLDPATGKTKLVGRVENSYQSDLFSCSAE